MVQPSGGTTRRLALVLKRVPSWTTPEQVEVWRMRATPRPLAVLAKMAPGNERTGSRQGWSSLFMVLSGVPRRVVDGFRKVERRCPAIASAMRQHPDQRALMRVCSGLATSGTPTVWRYSMLVPPDRFLALLIAVSRWHRR